MGNGGLHGRGDQRIRHLQIPPQIDGQERFPPRGPRPGSAEKPNNQNPKDGPAGGTGAVRAGEGAGRTGVVPVATVLQGRGHPGDAHQSGRRGSTGQSGSARLREGDLQFPSLPHLQPAGPPPRVPGHLHARPPAKRQPSPANALPQTFLLLAPRQRHAQPDLPREIRRPPAAPRLTLLHTGRCPGCRPVAGWGEMVQIMPITGSRVLYSKMRSLMLLVSLVAAGLAAVTPSIGLVGGYQPFSDYPDPTFQAVLQTVYRLHPEVKDWQPATAQRQLVNGFNFIFTLKSANGSQADVRAYSTFAKEVRLNSFVITSPVMVSNPDAKVNITISTPNNTNSVTTNATNNTTTNTTTNTPTNTTNNTTTNTTTSVTVIVTTNTTTTVTTNATNATKSTGAANTSNASNTSNTSNTSNPSNTVTAATTSYRSKFELFTDKKNGSYLSALSMAYYENPDLKGFEHIRAELFIKNFYYFKLTFENKLDPKYLLVTTKCLAFEKEPNNSTRPLSGAYQTIDLNATTDYDAVLKQVLAYEPSLDNLVLSSVRRQVVAGYNYLFLFEDRVRMENFTVRAYVNPNQNVSIDIQLIDTALGYSQEAVEAVTARSYEKWATLAGYGLVMVSNIWEKGSGLRLNFQKGNAYADVYFYLDGTDERFIIYYH